MEVVKKRSYSCVERMEKILFYIEKHPHVVGNNMGML